jgi:PAS domain-containing protein
MDQRPESGGRAGARDGDVVTRTVGQPLPLILARNLVAAITVPGFVTDDEGSVIFYNDAAGRLLGRRFEETGRLTREEWSEIGPLDAEGNPLDWDALPLTTALRENRPAHQRFRICTDERTILMVETSAVPLTAADGHHGAIVVFWPGEDDAR